MKILRLTPHFYYTKDIVDSWDVHMDQVGGMQVQLYRQAIALSQRDIYQLVCPIGMKKAPPRWVINDNLVVEKSNLHFPTIKSKERGIHGLYTMWLIGTLLKMVQVKKTDFDLVHVHSCALVANLLSGIFAKSLFKIPLVYTIHRSRIETFQPRTPIEKLTNDWAKKIESWCLHQADKIIVLNPKAKCTLIDGYGIQPNVISIIPDVIDFDEFARNASENSCQQFRKQHNLPTNQKVITFIGRMNYEKGCLTLLKAFNILKSQNSILLLCGDGNERPTLEQFVHDHKMTHQVRFTGYLSNDEVATAIACSDIIVMPSIYEEFGGIILEVAALGKPLIASNVGGIPTIVRDEETALLCTANDHIEFASKIECLLKNKSQAEKLGDNLRNDLLERYNFEASIVHLIQLYKGICQ